MRSRQSKPDMSFSDSALTSDTEPRTFTSTLASVKKRRSTRYCLRQVGRYGLVLTLSGLAKFRLFARRVEAVSLGPMPCLNGHAYKGGPLTRPTRRSNGRFPSQRRTPVMTRPGEQPHFASEIYSGECAY